ncbi:hypothetical protein JCM17380_16920 [Desulfosporosinus burensis]
MTKWRETKVKEIVNLNPETLSTKCDWQYINYLDTGNITKGEIDTFQLLNMKTDKIPSRAKRLVNDNDIIYSTVRPNHEHYGIIKNCVKNMVVSTGFAVLRIKEKLCDSDFLYYFITQRENTEYLSNVAEDSTTAYPSIKPDILMELDITLPALSEQKAITSILSSLDDKIHLLNRQNKTLESLSETFFRQWFIEEVGDDWESGVLGDFVDITRGASPRPIHEYVVDGVFPWVKISDATASSSFFINKTKEKIRESGIAKSVVAKQGEIILSNSATCGLLYVMGIDGCIHDGWLIFRNYRIMTKWFLFFLLKSLSKQLIAVADGTVQDNLNTTILKETMIQLPPKELINKFEITVNALMKKIVNNNNQIRTLTALRDTLLPKLISGELRVKM